VQKYKVEDQEHAGFWIRTFATVIDSVLMILLILSLVMMLGLGETEKIFGPMNIVLNLSLIATTIVFWIFKGATPGKMITKIKMVDAKTGDSLTASQSVIRYLGYVISTLPFMLGFFWIAFDKNKQGWHDKIAGTVVIKSD